MAVRDATGLRRRRCAALWGWSRLSSQAEELHERTEAQKLVWTSSGRGERDAPGVRQTRQRLTHPSGAGARPLKANFRCFNITLNLVNLEHHRYGNNKTKNYGYFD